MGLLTPRGVLRAWHPAPPGMQGRRHARGVLQFHRSGHRRFSSPLAIPPFPPRCGQRIPGEIGSRNRAHELIDFGTSWVCPPGNSRPVHNHTSPAASENQQVIQLRKFIAPKTLVLEEPGQSSSPTPQNTAPAA